MQGRLENEMKIQQATDKIIQDMPKYMQEWYLNMKASRKTASSCQDYARKIRKFLLYINSNPKEVNPEDVTLQACESYMISCQTKIDDYGLIVYTSDSYQQTIWCALNNFLKFLCKRGYIEKNYMEDIEKPKNRDLDRVNNDRVLLTSADFNSILQAAQKGNSFMNGIFNNRDILIILLFMTTGMRETALMEIDISDIDIQKHLLYVVDKGNKTHLYILNDTVIKYLKLWINDRSKIVKNQTDALFISKAGNRITSRSISNIVRKYCYDALGISLSPHKLRSGFCSILYNQTHDVEFVRRVVGHSNVHTTQRYIKTDETEKQKATEIMGDLLNI